MELKVFMTLWGYTGSIQEAVQHAIDSGYDGIEGPVPGSSEAVNLFGELLESHSLAYIAEIATAGMFVPDRTLPVDDHLADIKHNLERLKPLNPVQVTCLGGCDAWDVEKSAGFFKNAMGLADRFQRNISFETHRGRSLFNPWVTRDICNRIPDLRLTCDFSHWYVVCEGIQPYDESIIRELVPHAQHIHGRVGYDQGPQVPDPRTEIYLKFLQQHLNWWRWIWEHHALAGFESTTMTPEFGTDGYDYRDPVSGECLVEPTILNDWMNYKLRNEYRIANIT
ncbi:MAG: sugar phosphate isomerase/epimerase [Gammaproteobacteria bacterium]|nr:sugar phosphate isomerase/epimerase [Gammaproteobacteria bacterium]